MQDLKTTTREKSFLTIFQNYGTASQTHRSYSTMRSLVINCSDDSNSVVKLPTEQELAISSPSKSRKKRGKYVCQLCEIEWESWRESTLPPGFAVTIRDVNSGNILSVWV